MRAAVLPILVTVLTACVGPPEPEALTAGLWSVAEVTAGRLLDGDPAGAAQAIAALARV